MLPGLRAALLASTFLGPGLPSNASVVHKATAYSQGSTFIEFGFTARAGDLIVVAMFDPNSIPNLPSGYTSVYASSAGGAKYRLCYKVAVGGESNIPSGLFVTSVVLASIYRGFGGFSEIGATNLAVATSTAAAIPALTLQNTGGKSLIAGFAWNLDALDWVTIPPSGMKTVYDSKASGQTLHGSLFHADKQTSFTGARSLGTATSTSWACFAVEIKLTQTKTYTANSTIVLPDYNQITVTAEGAQGPQGAQGPDGASVWDVGRNEPVPGGTGGPGGWGGVGGKAVKTWNAGNGPAAGSTVSITVSGNAMFSFGSNPTGSQGGQGGTGYPGTDAQVHSSGGDTWYEAGSPGAQGDPGAPGAATGGDSNIAGGSSAPAGKITVTFS